METVDIVNESNKVRYHISKDKAHKKGLLHRAIISEVINSEGTWLLVKQAGDRQDADQFVSPVGGHMKAGESEIEALEREAFEELGIKNFTYKFVGKAIFNRFILNRHENNFFIVYEIYSDSVPTLNHESTEFRRFTQKEIVKLLKNDPKIFGDVFHFVAQNIFNNFKK